MEKTAKACYQLAVKAHSFVDGLVNSGNVWARGAVEIDKVKNCRVESDGNQDDILMYRNIIQVRGK